MSKASNNTLLGSGKVEKVEKKEKVNADGPVKLYRKDYPQGRVYKGAEVIEMMKRKGWKEKSVEVVKKEVEEKKEKETELKEIEIRLEEKILKFEELEEKLNKKETELNEREKEIEEREKLFEETLLEKREVNAIEEKEEKKNKGVTVKVVPTKIVKK